MAQKLGFRRLYKILVLLSPIPFLTIAFTNMGVDAVNQPAAMTSPDTLYIALNGKLQGQLGGLSEERALAACDENIRLNRNAHVQCYWKNALIRDSIMGRFGLYENGHLGLYMANISKDQALIMCEREAAAQLDVRIRCHWNDKRIFLSNDERGERVLPSVNNSEMAIIYKVKRDKPILFYASNTSREEVVKLCRDLAVKNGAIISCFWGGQLFNPTGEQSWCSNLNSCSYIATFKFLLKVYKNGQIVNIEPVVDGTMAKDLCNKVKAAAKPDDNIRCNWRDITQ